MVGKTAFFHEDSSTRGPRSLQTLLRDRNLLPCFQAIHSLNTGLIRGYEFLARSSYPGIETAGALFEQARRAGREVELSTLCRSRGMEFQDRIEPTIPLFFNTHPAEPLLEITVPQMRELRQMYPNREIVLEIHEAAITDPNLVREIRRRLADAEVRLAFDDFGRGQARIRELICAPSDYIKFDSALINDLQQVSSEQFRFFRSIIQGIKNEGAITVAEGVETEVMAQVCRDIGFDLVQGYLFSRPTLVTLT
jgi:EAL domain-containing protein (putative c-di-GMP-specific phosphodiesterase class I)